MINLYQHKTAINNNASERFLIITFFLGIALCSVNPWITFFLLTVASIYIFITKNNFGVFDFSTILLLTIFAFFAYNSITFGGVAPRLVLWYTIPSLFSFFIGRNIVKRINQTENIYFFFFVCAFSLALPNLIITILDIYHNGLINPLRTLSIIDSDVQKAVTARAIELSLALSGIAFAFRKDNSLKKTTKWFVIMSIVSFICILHYLSRTGVVLFAISIIIGALFNKKISSAVVFLILGIVVYSVLRQIGIIQLFEEREIVGSSFSDAGGRVERWSYGWKMMLEHPSGYFRETGFSHNFWLDFATSGGIMSFITLTLFSVIIFIKSIVLFKNKEIPNYLRQVILLFSIIFLLGFFTEPIHLGETSTMYVYFLFSGMVLQISKSYK